MSLSEEERKLVIEALEKYPAGIPYNAWGFGPMIEHPDWRIISPEEFSEKVLDEYG